MKKFVMGFLVAAILFSTAGVYAATNPEKTIKVLYNVKAIKFDGVAKTTSHTPFVYNGATYVPIRFIAENFGKEVVWDSKTQSVLINTKKPAATANTAYLGGDVKYMTYQEQYSANGAKIVYNGNVSLNDYHYDFHKGTVAKDNMGNQYKHYIEFGSGYYHDASESESYLEFPIKAGYTKFSGKVAIPEEFKDTSNTALVEFLVDGEVVQSKEMKPGAFPEDVSFDVSGGKKLTIRFIESDNPSKAVFGLLIGNPVYKK